MPRAVKPLRIFFINYFDAGIHDPRGTKIAQSLSKQGHDVTWVFGEDKGTRNLDRVRFHKINLLPLPFRLKEIAFAKEAAAWVSKQSFDVGVGFSHIGGLACYWAGKKTKTPFVFDYPDPLYPSDPAYAQFYSPLDRSLAQLFERVEKKALQAADTVAVISPHFGQMVHDRYGVSKDRIFVAPNAPDASLFKPSIQKYAEFTLAYTGKAIPEYGLGWLLECFSKCSVGRLLLVVKTEPEWKKWLDSELQRLNLEKRTIVHENVSPAKVSALIGRAHAAVFPYPRGQINDHASPNKLFEYLALGLPVITRDLPEAKRILQEGGCGLLATDSKSFCDAVQSLSKNPKKAQEMSHAARALALKEYDWRNVAVDYEKRLQAAAVQEKG